ncbi:uncharacterized protein AAGF69_014184 isoform 3-T3 [Amazona ochrocephala]
MQINSGLNKLIGVHCTHGLNRTGYLVCSVQQSSRASYRENQLYPTSSAEACKKELGTEQIRLWLLQSKSCPYPNQQNPDGQISFSSFRPVPYQFQYHSSAQEIWQPQEEL